MILVPYFLIGAFVLKIAIEEKNKGRLLLIGVSATIYGLWLLYASGLNYLLLSAILYLPGLYFYVQAKREQGINPFKGREKFGVGVLGFLALTVMAMIWQGSLSVTF
ncbi:hypothetical protein TW81_02735 [Vibrio galatheae]|uniref:Arginine:ornithine antiporter n=1 Tax=Vibrio galatheae TaxID=579748 RepID=A0A0F4NQ13_9VIBR|nr:hypothetical protein TW81_02735 [Vibrio galatheae]